MRAAIYSRKSVKSETGDSIENQVALCRQYIEQHWPQADIEVYEDEGFSGATLQRPRFAALMEAVQAGQVDMLVCYRLDRVSRSVTDFAALIETLNRRQVSFVCIREQFDTATPMGKAMLYIASVFAQLERETIAERVSDNMQMLARTGQWLGGRPPLGFRSVPASRQTAAGVKTGHRLQTAPEEAQAVQAAFAAFEAAGTVRAAQKALQKRGIEYTAAGVKSLLRNPVYCKADEQAYRYFAEQGAVLCFAPSQATGDKGLMVYNKRQNRKKPGAWRPQAQWVVALGRHEGMIEGGVWRRVQQKLAKQTRERQPQNRYALFSGLLRCGVCGAPMEAKKRAKGHGFDYICRRKRRQGAEACRGPNLAGEKADASLEQAVWQAVGPYLQREAAEKGASAAQTAAQRQLEQAIRLLSELPETEPLIQQLRARRQPQQAPAAVTMHTLSLAQKQTVYRSILAKIVWQEGVLHLYFS